MEEAELQEECLPMEVLQVEEYLLTGVHQEEVQIIILQRTLTR